jgi:hypothetical protein
MKIYVPYSGPEMPAVDMVDIGRRLGIDVDISHEGRKRIRKTSWNVAGKPHQEYSVRLYPVKGSDRFRKFGSGGRRSNGICWHGHREFMKMFFQEYPDASLRSALATYISERNFLLTHEETNDQQWNRNSTCNCAK